MSVFMFGGKDFSTFFVCVWKRGGRVLFFLFGERKFGEGGRMFFVFNLLFCINECVVVSVISCGCFTVIAVNSLFISDDGQFSSDQV